MHQSVQLRVRKRKVEKRRLDKVGWNVWDSEAEWGWTLMILFNTLLHFIIECSKRKAIITKSLTSSKKQNKSTQIHYQVGSILKGVYANNLKWGRRWFRKSQVMAQWLQYLRRKPRAICFRCKECKRSK